MVVVFVEGGLEELRRLSRRSLSSGLSSSITELGPDRVQGDNRSRINVSQFEFKDIFNFKLKG